MFLELQQGFRKIHVYYILVALGSVFCVIDGEGFLFDQARSDHGLFLLGFGARSESPSFASFPV